MVLDAIEPVAACLEGGRAAPPDDCGGPGGCADLIEVTATPAASEHQERRDWTGEDWDPEAFDLKQLNSKLRRIRFPSRR